MHRSVELLMQKAIMNGKRFAGDAREIKRHSSSSSVGNRVASNIQCCPNIAERLCFMYEPASTCVTVMGLKSKCAQASAHKYSHHVNIVVRPALTVTLLVVS